MEKERYNSIDLFKLIMAIFVVAIHTQPYVNFRSVIAVDCSMFLNAMAVPFFFLASGFLLSKSMQKSAGNLLDELLHRHLFRIVRLYVIGNMLYLPLVVYHYIVDDYSIIKAAFDYLRGIFITGSLYHAYILWYLLATIYALLFIGILKKRGLDTKSIVFVGGLIHLTGILINAMIGFEWPPGCPTAYLKYFLAHSIGGGKVLSAFFYFPLGMLLSEIKISGKRSLLYMGVGLLAFLLFQNNQIREIAAIISSVGLMGGGITS